MAVSEAIHPPDLGLPSAPLAPSAPAPGPTPYLTPETARPRRMLWGYVVSIVGLHLLALLVFVPWFFSWTGVVLFFLGHYFFGVLGICVGYHRLLTHRGFTCPRWLEHIFALCGVCCLEDTPARWVAIHRMHHQHSDDHPDPHTPYVNFFWSHMGWLFVENREHNKVTTYERYSRDLLRDSFYLRLERNFLWLQVYAAHALLFFLGGLTAGWIMTESYWEGLQFGLSVLVWGVFFRTVFVWHCAWAVNSVTHIWGYRNYQTADNSRNNWLVALLAGGEGWHNNHHASPRCAVHGHKWYEFDISYLTLRALAAVGLVGNIVMPGKRISDEIPAPE